MSTGKGAELLRSERDPQRAGYLELFLDLVYVFALTQLSHDLVGDLTWRGVFETLVALFALWWVWTLTAWATNRLDPTQPAIQLVAIPIMFGILLMAIAAPTAFGPSGLLFAGAYVAIQVGRSAFIVRTVHVQPEHHSAVRILIWSAVSAVPWIWGALTYGTARAVLWALAVALTFLMVAIDFRLPRLGSARTVDWAISGEHLSERYRQITIIAFGHTILSAGLVFRQYAFEGVRAWALVVVFITTVLLWRIYYFHAGALLAAAIASARTPGRLGRTAAYAHLLMVTGIVVTSVGEEIIIRHPLEQTNPAWVGAILTGSTLFLTGRAWLDYTTFSRIAWSRVSGLLVLAAMAPVMLLLSPIMVAVVANIVLLGIATSDTIAWRIFPREPAPPSG